MWLLTFAWLLYLVVTINGPGASLASLKLNELGDFLAGGFAPLAFAWLVYGYFMQATELGLQREELQLQREEMANTRGEIARQATAIEEANSAAKEERSRREEPIFLLELRSGGPTYFRLYLQNNGGTAIDTCIVLAPTEWRVENGTDHVGTIVAGSGRAVTIVTSSPGQERRASFRLEYGTSMSDRRWCAEWQVAHNTGVTQARAAAPIGQG